MTTANTNNIVNKTNINEPHFIAKIELEKQVGSSPKNALKPFPGKPLIFAALLISLAPFILANMIFIFKFSNLHIFTLNAGSSPKKTLKPATSLYSIFVTVAKWSSKYQKQASLANKGLITKTIK